MRILVAEMEEQIIDIDNTIRVFNNTRRRLMLLDAGYSEEMLDGDLYRSLKSLKQNVYYRDNVIKEKDLKIGANEIPLL